MVGYHSTSGYKVFNPSTNKVFVSRDVICDKANSWDWFENYNSLNSDNSVLFEFEERIEEK